MGNTYILEHDIRKVNYMHIVDETFSTAYTFIDGHNTYNGKLYYYRNTANATHIRAGHGGTPGLEIQCNANASQYSATARTAPGLDCFLSTWFPTFDMLRQQLFIIVEVSANPTSTGQGVGFAYDINWDTAAKDRHRLGFFYDAGQKVIFECIVNGSANQPLVSVASTYKAYMLVIGQGQYAAFYRSAYSGNPIESDWNLLASNDLAVPSNRNYRWNEGSIYLYAQGANFAGIIKRYTFGYINIF